MTAELHTLVGAYALNALSAEEQARFEQHLATCAACRAEQSELQATAARLADANWETPPAGIKARLMDAVRRTAQDRPLGVSPTHTGRGRWLPVMLTAAAVLAIVASLGAFFVERDRLADAQQQQRAVAGRLAVLERQEDGVTAVLSAPDVRIRSASLDNGGSVRVIVAPSLNSALIAMDNLPILGDQYSYQIWQVGRGDPVSAVVMPADAKHRTGTQLLDNLGKTQAIAVTVEPEGGSTRPTTDPIASIALT
ncbi:MAG: anti-sigma factor [Nocardioidaceae bacterium]|nr:anti-sigma factor [Nocardioidaceae bacterium]